MSRILSVVAMLLIAASAAAAERSDIGPLLKTLGAVGPEGQGHREASEAWAKLAQADADQLPAILAALDDANPLAANWIRAAVDSIAERQLQHGQELPVADLEKFLGDTRHAPRARRLAYEWIARADSTAPDRLVPRMLDDPSVELRRDAVARLLVEAGRLNAEQKSDEALVIYQKAMSAARDLDQVQLASGELKKLGQPVDIARHFGFIRNWAVVGPFDNAGKRGFAIAYLPETEAAASGPYLGKARKVAWAPFATEDEYGQVDLNKALGKHSGAAAYARAEFYSPRRQAVELRLGSDDAIKIWLNGKLLCQADVYHAFTRMDQYIGRGQLEAGRNVILVKVCQNEQTEDWAQEWKFQLRVCDATGTGLLSQDPAEAGPASRKTAAEAPKAEAKP